MANETQVYFTTSMPKTATGKIQRRLVAKSMIENEKRYQETKEDSRASSSGSLKGTKSRDEGRSKLSMFKMLSMIVVGIFGVCLHRSKE